MATTINNTGVLFPDSTQNSSAKQVARAWAVFQNSTIYGSFNVSSTSRVSTGLYQMNYTNAGPNQWNAAIGNISLTTDDDWSRNFEIGGTNNSSAVRLTTGVRDGGNTPFDVTYVCLVVYWS